MSAMSSVANVGGGEHQEHLPPSTTISGASSRLIPSHADNSSQLSQQTEPVTASNSVTSPYTMEAESTANNAAVPSTNSASQDVAISTVLENATTATVGSVDAVSANIAPDERIAANNDTPANGTTYKQLHDDSQPVSTQNNHKSSDILSPAKSSLSLNSPTMSPSPSNSLKSPISNHRKNLMAKSPKSPKSSTSKSPTRSPKSPTSPEFASNAVSPSLAPNNNYNAGHMYQASKVSPLPNQVFVPPPHPHPQHHLPAHLPPISLPTAQAYPYQINYLEQNHMPVHIPPQMNQPPLISHPLIIQPHHLNNIPSVDSKKKIKKNSRRKHRNSHLGCGTCKKRRIKCDESLPACHNCVKGKLHCAYLNLDSNARSALRMAQYNQSLRQEKVETNANDKSSTTSPNPSSPKNNPNQMYPYQSFQISSRQVQMPQQVFANPLMNQMQGMPMQMPMQDVAQQQIAGPTGLIYVPIQQTIPPPLPSVPPKQQQPQPQQQQQQQQQQQHQLQFDRNLHPIDGHQQNDTMDHQVKLPPIQNLTHGIDKVPTISNLLM